MIKLKKVKFLNSAKSYTQGYQQLLITLKLIKFAINNEKLVKNRGKLCTLMARKIPKQKNDIKAFLINEAKQVDGEALNTAGEEQNGASAKINKIIRLRTVKKTRLPQLKKYAAIAGKNKGGIRSHISKV